MFHVKQRLVLVGILLSVIFQTVTAQGSYNVPDTPFSHPEPNDSLEWVSFRKNPAILKLSPKEQEFFRWVNLFRKNPLAFRDRYITLFLVQFPTLKGPETRSLLEDLELVRPMEPFMPDLVLNKTSLAHASDLSKKAHVLDHNSSNGTSFRARMEMAGKRNCAGENLYDGKNDPLFALIILLIDHGVPGAGHRKAIMKAEFTRMGVSITPWKADSNSVILVQDFSCD